MIFMSCVMLAKGLLLILLMGGVALWFCGVSKVPGRMFLKNLKPFWLLFIATFAIHLFVTEGKPIFKFTFLDITQEGFYNGLLYTTRLVILLTFATLLTLTTEPIELTDGLERTLLPLRKFKFPVHEFTMMVMLALRFIPILIDEAERIKRAQISRGASLSGNFFKRMKKLPDFLLPMVMPLFVSSFRRAEMLAIAMELRNFMSSTLRTHYNQLKFKREDLIFLILTFGFLVIFFYIKY